MRYLLLFTIAVLACSFNICQKIVKKDKGWEMYVYPDCSDSTTYLKQIYYARDPYNERRNGDWARYEGEYDIDERFYIHDFIWRTSSYVFKHNDSLFTDKVYYGEENSEEFYRKVMPENRRIITEKYDIYIGYYSDGTFKYFSVMTDPNNDSRATSCIQWDSLHSTRWEGVYKVDIFREPEERVDISHDTDVKNGWWKKYNDKNEVLDSIYYPDPKH